MFQEILLDKIASRRLRLAVVGVGYVGLPLAAAFAEAGFWVTGIETAQERVDDLNQGKSYIRDVPSTAVQRVIDAERFRATSDYAAVRDADAIVICVPTPLRKTKDPDIAAIIDAVEEISKYGCAGKLIVLESTTYPGTTEEVILPRLSGNGLRVGEDFFLAFSPERIDPGRSDFVFSNTPKVVGGVTPACLEVAAALYGCVVEQVVPVSNTAAAEMTKLLENTFRAVNIGLVNEVALMCDRLGLSVWEVVEAAATKPYGFMPFYPGPGLGGHCIAVDPHYLSWKLRTLNYTTRFIELAAEINSFMPQFVTGKIAIALNEMVKPVKGSTILLLGVAYKPNVGDVRESPALDVIHLLTEQGADVRYHDALLSERDRAMVPAQAVDLTAETLGSADCVVVITNHDGYDWPWIAGHSRLIVDTRNALEGIAHDHIFHL
jgi:UDP-N-acetyl-D-glucosamine dehydrogenase